jgi:hypothetical protein
VYGLRDFTAANSYATQAGGGEAGVASGFGILALISVDALNASASRYLFGCSDTTPSVGWMLHVSIANAIRFYAVNGAGTAVPSSPYQLTTTDAGKILIVNGWRDGAGVHRVMVSAVEQATVAAASGYLPRAAAPTTFSGVAGAPATAAATGITEYGLTTWRGTPSDAQLRAATALARTLGDVPDAIEGATVTHCWSVKRTVAASNPAHGAAAPATIPDVKTGATVDVMTKVGSPTVAVPAASTPRMWSYETTPFLRGATGFAPTDRYERAGGFGGDAAGFFAQAFVQVPTFAVTSRVRSVFGNFNGTSGFLLYSYGTNNTYQAVFCNGVGTAVAAPSAVLSASDIGKLLTVTMVYDAAAGRVRLYIRRTEQSAGNAIVGFTPRVGGTFCLGEGGYGSVSDGYTLLGFQYGLGVPSLAEIQANHDATLVAEDVVAFSGTTSLYSFTQDGGVPSTLSDRKGSAHFKRVGSGAIIASDIQSRSWGW